MTELDTALIALKTMRCLQKKDAHGVSLSAGAIAALGGLLIKNPTAAGVGFLAGYTLTGLGMIGYCGYEALTEKAPPVPHPNQEQARPTLAWVR